MMLQRELIRMGAAFLAGATVGLALVCYDSSLTPWAILLLGLHGICVLYSASFCWQMIKKIYGIYFQSMMMGYWMGGGLLKSIFMGLLLAVALTVVTTVGCLLGWLRCAYCLVSAVQADREYF